MENVLALLIQARDVAHIHHWKVKSFSKHMALGELYELLTSFADQLAEMYMGDLGNNNKMGDIVWDNQTGWDKTDPDEFVAQLHTNLENLKPMIPQKDWLINKYEELQGEVARVKYKMDNLN